MTKEQIIEEIERLIKFSEGTLEQTPIFILANVCKEIVARLP